MTTYSVVSPVYASRSIVLRVFDIAAFTLPSAVFSVDTLGLFISANISAFDTVSVFVYLG